jgi:hypothetical protein
MVLNSTFNNISVISWRGVVNQVRSHKAMGKKPENGGRYATFIFKGHFSIKGVNKFDRKTR